MGGVVGITLASGWFGVPVTCSVAIGVKLEWTQDELDAAARTRERPVKWYESRTEAEDRFVRLAGLPPAATTDSRLLTAGVEEVNGRFRVAADPRAASIGAPPIESLIAAAVAPVHLVCGAFDHMVGIDQLRRFDAGAVEIPHCGHCAHIEAPSAVAQFVTTRALPTPRAST
jgi:pimeloyl-ACP methyl ester carboxylesterase